MPSPCVARTLVLLLVLTSLRQAGVNAADWPQWRGPHRDGIAVGEYGLLDRWPSKGPDLLWRASGFGSGYSSLAIAGDVIVTMGDLQGNQCVIAAGLADGAIRWVTDVGPAHASTFAGPRSTPTIDGHHVFSMSTAGKVHCLDLETGASTWSVDLAKQFGGFMAHGNDVDWKFSESVLVDEDRVVVTPGAPEALMVALDKHSGNEIWRTKQSATGEFGADGAAYSSIVVSHAAGVKQYVTLTGRGAVGVDAKSGVQLWGYDRIANMVANVPTPIVDGDHVFVSTGYGTGGALLQIVRQGEGIQAKEVYFDKKFENHHGGMILSHGHVYFGKGNNGGLPVCIEFLTGETKWGPIRNRGKGSAAIGMADGHLYLRYQNGLMVLVEARPDRYEEKGAFMIPDVEDRSWSHPVIVGQKLYLREQNNLFCYDLAK